MGGFIIMDKSEIRSEKGYLYLGGFNPECRDYLGKYAKL
jgi:hypothetical protein